MSDKPDSPKELAENAPELRNEDGTFKRGHKGLAGAGRPLGSISLRHLIRRRLREDPKKADAIVDNLLEQAAFGEAKALGFIKEAIVQTDGLPTQQVETVDATPVRRIVLEDRRAEESEESE